jgi:hypothetical protein
LYLLLLLESAKIVQLKRLAIAQVEQFSMIAMTLEMVVMLGLEEMQYLVTLVRTVGMGLGCQHPIVSIYQAHISVNILVQLLPKEIILRENLRETSFNGVQLPVNLHKLEVLEYGRQQLLIIRNICKDTFYNTFAHSQPGSLSMVEKSHTLFQFFSQASRIMFT